MINRRREPSPAFTAAPSLRSPRGRVPVDGLVQGRVVVAARRAERFDRGYHTHGIPHAVGLEIVLPEQAPQLAGLLIDVQLIEFRTGHLPAVDRKSVV